MEAPRGDALDPVRGPGAPRLGVPLADVASPLLLDDDRPRRRADAADDERHLRQPGLDREARPGLWSVYLVLRAVARRDVHARRPKGCRSAQHPGLAPRRFWIVRASRIAVGW